ncbi:hypothetical protein [Dactylosporangium salmoneum]|uniref:hypothetical protein n=1 Tax=Dactylosporangium salmoneum TaxID=53361 RepID=UPI0031E4881F
MKQLAFEFVTQYQGHDIESARSKLALTDPMEWIEVLQRLTVVEQEAVSIAGRSVAALIAADAAALRTELVQTAKRARETVEGVESGLGMFCGGHGDTLLHAIRAELQNDRRSWSIRPQGRVQSRDALTGNDV